MDIQTKDFPVLSGEATDEYPNGSFEVILSAPTQDRDGEIVDSKAFEPLPDHITFDTDHSMTCDSVVGSGKPSYAPDGTLRVKGGFASDARSQTIRQKVAEGHIRTTSVTFMAAKRVNDEKGVPHVTQAELLNGTFTPVPSNRESVVVAAKAITLKEGRRNNKGDAEQIQAIHDSAATLGANCGAKSARPTDRKDADTEADDDPGTIAQAVDAAIDEAIDLFAAVDAATLPPEVQQAIALVQAADASVDTLLALLGVADPDEDAEETPKMSGQETEGKAADDTADAAAEAAASAVKSAAVPEDALARLRNTQNAAHIAFGA
jgi:hypothetical protein